MENVNNGATAGNSWNITAQTFGTIQHGSNINSEVHHG